MKLYHISNTKFKKFSKEFAPQGVHWFASNKDSLIWNGHRSTIASTPVYLYSCDVVLHKTACCADYEKYGLGALFGKGCDSIELDGDFIVFNTLQISIEKVEKIYNTEAA